MAGYPLSSMAWGTFPLPFRDATVRRSGEQLYLYDEETRLSLPLHGNESSHALPLASVDRVNGIGLWSGYDVTVAWAETRLGRWLHA